MRNRLLIGGIVVAALLLAGLGAAISLIRSLTSLAPSPTLERSTAR
jgi:hypothetical protein